MGVALGGADASGIAIEHQALGPPHGHGNVHLVNCYLYNTLHDVAEMVRHKLLDPQSILDFHEWVHREEPFDLEVHEAQRNEIEND